MVLGSNFLENENKHHVNKDIMSYFIASLFNLGEERLNILMLIRNKFKVECLGNEI